jgi:uncharacterized protein (DUF924 family)
MQQAVLNFWFEETPQQSWWSANPEFDELIRQRFGPVLEQAARAELSDWRSTPMGRLAEIIVLDQFSRNVYRNTARAFSQDAMALVLSQEAIATGAPREMKAIEQVFLFMPFMHSESRLIHQQAEVLFRNTGLKSNLEFELKHKAIIDRFGRYPHRNKILERTSSAEEIEFLKQAGSSF